MCLNHSTAYPHCLRFFNRDLLYGHDRPGISGYLPNVGTGLFRGRPRFGIINTVSTWITRIGYLCVPYPGIQPFSPIGRDFCQRLIRKLAHTVPIDSVQRFYARLTVRVACHNGQRATLVARFKTIKILTRYGMDAKSFSVWRVYCWWNKLKVPVCRYFFLTILLRYAVSNWEISLEYIKYIVERMWIWNTYFWFYLVIGNAFFWNEFL